MICIWSIRKRVGSTMGRQKLDRVDQWSKKKIGSTIYLFYRKKCDGCDTSREGAACNLTDRYINFLMKLLFYFNSSEIKNFWKWNKIIILKLLTNRYYNSVYCCCYCCCSQQQNQQQQKQQQQHHQQPLSI